MPEEARGKSPHLQDMEEKFAKRTRRFSPFSVLGLSGDGNIGDDTSVDNDAQLAEQAETPILNGGVDETHRGVESTPGGGTHPHVGGNHAKVVERSKSAEVTTTGVWYPHTHMYVDTTHTPSEESIEALSGDRLLDQPTGQPQIALWHSDEQVQDIAAAMVLR